MAILNAAARAFPDNPAVLSNMAMALAAEGDAVQAEALLRRAVAQPGASLQERQNLTLVLGIQGNLWTEHVRTTAYADRMFWPRGAALAELFAIPRSLAASGFSQRELAPFAERAPEVAS